MGCTGSKEVRSNSGTIGEAPGEDNNHPPDNPFVASPLHAQSASQVAEKDSNTQTPILSPTLPNSTKAPVPRLDDHTRRIFDEKTPHMYAQIEIFRRYPTDFFQHYLVRFDSIFTLPDITRLTQDCYSLFIRDLKEITWREVNQVDPKKEREKIEKFTPLQKKQYLQKQIQDINSTSLDISLVLKFMPYENQEENIYALALFILYKMGSEGYITQANFLTGWELQYDTLFNLNLNNSKLLPLAESNLVRRKRLIATLVSISMMPAPQVPRRILLAHTNSTLLIDENIVLQLPPNAAAIVTSKPYKFMAPEIFLTSIQLVWQYYVGNKHAMHNSFLMVLSYHIVLSIVSDLKEHCEELVSTFNAAQLQQIQQNNVNPLTYSSGSSPIISGPVIVLSDKGNSTGDLIKPVVARNPSSQYSTFNKPGLQKQHSNSVQFSTTSTNKLTNAVSLMSLFSKHKPLHILITSSFQQRARDTLTDKTLPDLPASTTFLKSKKKADKKSPLERKRLQTSSSNQSISNLRLDSEDDDGRVSRSLIALGTGREPTLTFSYLFHKYIENVLPFYFDQSDTALYAPSSSPAMFETIPNQKEFLFGEKFQGMKLNHPVNVPVDFIEQTLQQSPSVLSPQALAPNSSVNSIPLDLQASALDSFLDPNQIYFQRLQTSLDEFYSKSQIPPPSKTLLNRIYLYLVFHLDHHRNGYVTKQSFLKYFIPAYCRLFDYDQRFHQFHTHSYYTPTSIISTNPTNVSGIPSQPNHSLLVEPHQRFYWNLHTVFSQNDCFDYTKWVSSVNLQDLRVKKFLLLQNAAPSDSLASPPLRFESGNSTDLIQKTQLEGGVQIKGSLPTTPRSSMNLDTCPKITPQQISMFNPLSNNALEPQQIIDIWHLPLLQPCRAFDLSDLIQNGIISEAESVNAVDAQRKSESDFTLTQVPDLDLSKLSTTSSSSKKDKKDKRAKRDSGVFFGNAIDDFGNTRNEFQLVVTHRALHRLNPLVDPLNFYDQLSQAYFLFNQSITQSLESISPASPNSLLSRSNSTGNLPTLTMSPIPSIPRRLQPSSTAKEDENKLRNNIIFPSRDSDPGASLNRLSFRIIQIPFSLTSAQFPAAIPIIPMQITLTPHLVDKIQRFFKSGDYFINPMNLTPSLASLGESALALPSQITFLRRNHTSEYDNADSPAAVSSDSSNDNRLSRQSYNLSNSSSSSSTFGYLRSSFNHDLLPLSARQCGNIDAQGNYQTTSPLQTQIELMLDRERIRRLTWISLSILTEHDMTSFPALIPYRAALDHKQAEKGSFQQLGRPITKPLSSSATVSSSQRKIGKGIGQHSNYLPSHSPQSISAHLISPTPLEGTIPSQSHRKSLLGGDTSHITQDQLSLQAVFRRNMLGSSDQTDFDNESLDFDFTISRRLSTNQQLPINLPPSPSSSNLTAMLIQDKDTIEAESGNFPSPNLGDASTISSNSLRGQRAAGTTPRSRPKSKPTTPRS